MLVAGPLASAPAANAGAVVPSVVSLKSVVPFSVLAGTYVAVTGSSTVGGDVGAGAAITVGASAGMSGDQHANSDQVDQTAQADLLGAYQDAEGRVPAPDIAGELGGQMLTGGVYHSTAALSLTGTLTLDGGGDSSTVFIIQTSAALVVAASGNVTLTGGAQASNVFWQVPSYVTLGAGSQFDGTILAGSYISFGVGSSLTGRALSLNGYVVIDSSQIRPHAAANAGAVVPSVVSLKSVVPFSVLAGTYVAVTGSSTVGGDVGAGAAITVGASAGMSGTQHANNDQVDQTAQADLLGAYQDAEGRVPAPDIAGELGGQMLTGGVYHSTAALSLTGTLTLDGGGDPSTVFIIQTSAALVVAASGNVTLTGGAQASNVFWQVPSYVTLGAGSQFDGTILAGSYITFGVGSSLTGRALSLNGYVVIDSSQIVT